MTSNSTKFRRSNVYPLKSSDRFLIDSASRGTEPNDRYSNRKTRSLMCRRIPFIKLTSANGASGLFPQNLDQPRDMLALCGGGDSRTNLPVTQTRHHMYCVSLLYPVIQYADGLRNLALGSIVLLGIDSCSQFYNPPSPRSRKYSLVPSGGH